MEQLPLEIWHDVVRYLDRKEWKVLRGTSTAFHTLTTPHVFGSIFVRPNVDSLTRAFSVAATPSLACLVVSLELYAESVSKNAHRLVEHMEHHHHEYGYRLQMPRSTSRCTFKTSNS